MNRLARNPDGALLLAKRELRKIIAERIDALSDRASRDRAVCGHLEQFINRRGGGAVFSFRPFRDEVDLRPLNKKLAERGIPVFFPVVCGENLRFRAVDGEAPHFSEKSPAVTLTPLRAFDPNGERLGRGGGHYDRFLGSEEGKLIVVGAGYAVQELDGIPCEPHDRRLHFVCTEEGIRNLQA